MREKVCGQSIGFGLGLGHRAGTAGIISETSEASYSYRTENVVREAILLYQPVAICIMILKHFSLASIWPLVSCLA